MREGLTLRFEGQKAVTVGSVGDIERALQALSPRGPSFVVLDAHGGDFAQAAGGQDAFTVEWRDRSGHWVAGMPGLFASAITAIPTMNSRVTIFEHERLTRAAASALLVAFAEDRWRPAKFVWRELQPQRGVSGRTAQRDSK